MGQTLDIAARQLFSRTDDELFEDIPQLIEFLRKREAVTKEVPVLGLEAKVIEANGTQKLGVDVLSDQGILPAVPTEWAFRSMCSMVKAPANYINKMEPERAAYNLNTDIKENFNGENVMSPVSGNDLRAFYTKSYERVPDLVVAERINDVCQKYGYEPAGRFAGKHVGMPPVRPEASGIYCNTDRDIFLFTLNDERAFEFEDDIYYHCAIVWNSEVTWKKLGWMMCLTRGVCGNHLIWDADEILTSEAVHKQGHDPMGCLDDYERLMEAYDQRAKMMVNHAQARLVAAKYTEFADTRENVEKRLATYMQKKQAAAALPFLDDQRAYPQASHSVFGVSQAITLYSQTVEHSATRYDLDVAAGKIVKDLVGF